MLSILIFVMIYAGVTLALYQVYDIHYNLNFDDEEIKSRAESELLKDLSSKAKQYEESGATSGFIQTVKDVFGRGLDYRIVLAAFAEEKKYAYAEPLLRRKGKVVSNGEIKILHLPFWKTSPPKKDIRGILLPLIILNSLLVLGLGGLSVYTIAYKVSIDSLWWFNDELILMLIIYTLVLINHLVSKFDIYMHDLYQIGKLSDSLSLDQAK